MQKFSFCLAVLLFAAAMQLHAQDSLARKSGPKAKADSIQNNIQHRFDSLKKIDKSVNSFQKKINHRSDSLQKALASPKNFVQSIISKRAHKKDSLSKQNKTKHDSLPKNTAQGKDSLKKDSTHRYSYKSLDSLQKKFHHRTDSLQQAFASPMGFLQAAIARRAHKKDSLSKTGRSTDSLSHEMDTLNKKKASRTTDLNNNLGKDKK